MEPQVPTRQGVPYYYGPLTPQVVDAAGKGATWDIQPGEGESFTCAVTVAAHTEVFGGEDFPDLLRRIIGQQFAQLDGETLAHIVKEGLS